MHTNENVCMRCAFCHKNHNTPQPITQSFVIAVQGGESVNATWYSTTPAVKPVSNDRQYYFLPYWDDKPTMWIRSTFPDHRRRMYNSNVIARTSDKLVISLCFFPIIEWLDDDGLSQYCIFQ